MKRVLRSEVLVPRHPRQRPIPDEPRERAVLCLEDHPGAGRAAVEQLAAQEGIEVLHCHQSATSDPCVGAGSDACPLDGEVALVLDARSGADGQLARGELGIVCAEQLDLPIVAAGVTRPDAATVPWASATCTLHDAATFCRALMNRPATLQAMRVEHAVRRVVGPVVGGEIVVTVHDWPSRLVVSVSSARLPEGGTCQAVSRALHAVLERPFVVVYSETD